MWTKDYPSFLFYANNCYIESSEKSIRDSVLKSEIHIGMESPQIHSLTINLLLHRTFNLYQPYSSSWCSYLYRAWRNALLAWQEAGQLIGFHSPWPVTGQARFTAQTCTQGSRAEPLQVVRRLHGSLRRIYLPYISCVSWFISGVTVVTLYGPEFLPHHFMSIPGGACALSFPLPWLAGLWLYIFQGQSTSGDCSINSGAQC